MSQETSGTASYKDGIFGIASSEANSRVVIIPVPWEVTTSYGGGTAMGPECVLHASSQVDLFDLELGDAHTQGYHLLPIPKTLTELNADLRPKALALRAELEDSGHLSPAGQRNLTLINEACAAMSEWVHSQATRILAAGKIPAVLGGDHSSPEGNIRAVSEALSCDLGILHVDAHADLREHYQGFERSHASIMNNVLRAPWKPAKLVQVGIRDFSEEEYALIEANDRIQTFFDLRLKNALFDGETWSALCRKIVSALPQQVYVSFDIDGLSPEYCPHTGTPVPGGLSFDQANALLRILVESGRKIVGFDLNEVAPGEDEWDGNVGARMLFKLCGWAVKSQPK